MKQEKTLFQECYQLLQNILLDAFNVSTLYFTYPYKDINKIDLGMRATVWNNYNDSDSKIHLSDSSQKYRILIVKSNLGFYNLMIFLSAGEKPDFISIGPFRNDKLSPNYFTQILKEAHIAPSDMQGMKYIYENMPFIQVDTITNVTKHVLEAFIPEFKEITPELLQYSEQKRAIEVNTDLIESNLLKFSEQYHALLFAFLKYLTCGDNNGAKKALHTFLRETKLTTNQNMRDFKMLLQSLNNYCHIVLLQTDIHPSHVIKQSFSISTHIENTTSPEKLEQIPNEICRKYCLLVKNYSNPNYSKLTKDVIAYIRLHLEEELSLNRLASHFKKNPSVLSNLFSKETGQPLTKFIHQTRIQEAVMLFHTTHMSVSEVALAVGYQDFSYFSKIFSQNVGCSPREYRQRHLST